MFKKIVIGLFTLAGLSFGLSLAPALWRYTPLNFPFMKGLIVNAIIFSIIFMMIGFLVYPMIYKATSWLQETLNRQSTANLFLGSLGLLIGLLVGYLVALPFAGLFPYLKAVINLTSSLVLGFVGYQTAMSRKEEWNQWINRTADLKEILSFNRNQSPTSEDAEKDPSYKILDTSVIIDGRIADIIQTGFIEGTILVPNFVLLELQHIADSSDAIIRAKGRRGLDILNKLQKDSPIPVEFYDKDFENVPQVDTKLLHLAKHLNGTLLTNDFNLNKVAEFQQVPILNINELANAVKPVLIPGEQLHVLVIKPGTERKQGVAYLEDGTMIVVEDGQLHLNEWVDVEVTSALQTAAGRMIFAKMIQ